ncbi:hypothetical protein HYDPIDRAFT_109932 [Hydnomerulius pinastri MD-312]|nr:hypothetical protein HYDPIDRAFT_109932 [Hydnomerulius pinastri MD-312]
MSSTNSRTDKDTNAPGMPAPSDAVTLQAQQPPIGDRSGKIPNSTDERCFTYCSQTARGRALGHPPTCRSICLRKVFPHEVMASLLGNGRTKNGQDNSKFPLPREGQPTASGDSNSPPESDDIRYWEEGWYLWTSRSHRGAVNKLHIMGGTLAWQDDWQRYMEKSEREQYSNLSTIPSPSARPPFPWERSSLIRLHLPLRDSLHHLLAPTFLALEICRRSFEEGSQRDFAVRMWETAQTRRPFDTARRIFKRVWDKLAEFGED